MECHACPGTVHPERLFHSLQRDLPEAGWCVAVGSDEDAAFDNMVLSKHWPVERGTPRWRLCLPMPTRRSAPR